MLDDVLEVASFLSSSSAGSERRSLEQGHHIMPHHAVIKVDHAEWTHGHSAFFSLSTLTEVLSGTLRGLGRDEVYFDESRMAPSQSSGAVRLCWAM